MTKMRVLMVISVSLVVGACATAPQPEPATEQKAAAPILPEESAIDVGTRWTEFSAEYQAISAQAYAVARRDLSRLVADPDWTALPGQHAVANKPPAIILDVDETVVSNADYQKTLVTAPYTRFLTGCARTRPCRFVAPPRWSTRRAPPASKFFS
jgi:acid phosphatase